MPEKLKGNKLGTFISKPENLDQLQMKFLQVITMWVAAIKVNGNFHKYVKHTFGNCSTKNISVKSNLMCRAQTNLDFQGSNILQLKFTNVSDFKYSWFFTKNKVCKSLTHKFAPYIVYY